MQTSCCHWDSRARSWNWACRRCPSVRATRDQGQPQDSFGAMFLSRQCSCRSAGSLVTLEPRELHLLVGTRVWDCITSPSPSLPLQPSVERKCLSQHMGAGTETSGELLAAQLPRGELWGGDASSTQSCSLLSKVTWTQAWSASSARNQEQHCSSAPHPICMRSLGSPHGNPSKPWTKVVMEVPLDGNTVAADVVGNSNRVRQLPIWRGSQRSHLFWRNLERVPIILFLSNKGNENWRKSCYWSYWIQDFTPSSHHTMLRYVALQV